MKRTFFYLVGVSIVATAVALTSCNVKGEDDDSMWGGMRMYENAAFQQFVSIEPFNVAIRLHILLSETEKQGLDDFEDENLTVKFGLDDNHSLRELMFGVKNSSSGASIEVLEDGAYKIVYPVEYNSYNDTWKTGTVTISTGDKLLNEPGASWEVVIRQTEEDKFTFRSLPEPIELSVNHYYIDNTGSGIQLVAYGVRATLNNASNWDMNFEMRKINSGDLYGYENISKAEFEVTGEASGLTMFSASHNYLYSFNKPGIYHAACAGRQNPYPIMSGEIDVSVITGTLDPETYPSRNVRMMWEDKKNCESRVTMFYNGKSTQ
jgi:hypothetical protein